jgi:hypothetical protein
MGCAATLVLGVGTVLVLSGVAMVGTVAWLSLSRGHADSYWSEKLPWAAAGVVSGLLFCILGALLRR